MVRQVRRIRSERRCASSQWRYGFQNNNVTVGVIGGYRFGGNSYEIFDKVFGSMNPFSETLEDDGRDQYGSMFGDAFGGKNEQFLTAPAEITITLDCTLHELYNGCLKKVQYSRSILLHDGKTTRQQKEELQVEVKAGTSEATILSYVTKGNEAYGHKPSALVIRFKQIAHSNYRRKDNDLIYTQSITLEQALQSQPVKIKALDGRNIIATIDEIITPQTVKLIEGEGMPITQDPVTDALNHIRTQLPRGNLYIRFDIEFPKKISNSHKQSLITILRQNTEENNL